LAALGGATGAGRPEMDGRDAAAAPRDLAHKCGVFAVVGHPDPVALTVVGLLALQHRGQEAAGIAVADGREGVFAVRGVGLVSEALRPRDLQALAGTGPQAAIGHVRYATTGASTEVNAQPLLLQGRLGSVAVAHNGNLTNALLLRMECEAAGAIFQTGSDTEVIPHLMARSGAPTLREALFYALDRIQGAFALAVLAADRLWLARDPHGIRPLALGRLGEAVVAASETCALDAVGAVFEREVRPGEVVEVTSAGARVVRPPSVAGRNLCLFEYIYLARPDSDLQGRNVHVVRKEMGRRLARSAPAAADVVVGVPDSGISAAVGYAEAAGIPFELGLIKNRYIGRTFIQPTQSLRENAVRMKLNAVAAVVRGRRVVLVDDSIVRGTTMRHLVGLVRHAGAAEVHVRVASPPFQHPCYYGIDIPSPTQLLATGHTPTGMAELIGADSLAFLDCAEAVDAVQSADGLCTACFSGRYPVPPLDAGAGPAAGESLTERGAAQGPPLLPAEGGAPR
jgi:amidophosphoribosyltransferase